MKIWRLFVVSALSIPIILCQNMQPPGNANVPQPVAKVDYGDLTLALINDFILMVQMFLTCVPSTALPPVVPDFVKISCLFNMISTFSLVSLNILNGWDKIDESRTFKVHMRHVFNQWAEDHEKRDLVKISNLQEIKKWNSFLDLHFDMYVVKYNDKEQQGRLYRLTCVSFEMGELVFGNRAFLQEVCVTKAGIRKLGENRLSRFSLEHTLRVAEFLVNGGFIKVASNPPLYLFKLMKTYGDLTLDLLQRLRDMATSVNIKSDDFSEKGYTFHEGEDLLMTLRLLRPQQTNTSLSLKSTL
ncbi:uncharacterized protein ZBIST_2532 [Zygosaccharomyces bailii]|nr:uncharacterized protein ZBIST_2532 [Zygosaccharomyces bailii]